MDCYVLEITNLKADDNDELIEVTEPFGVYTNEKAAIDDLRKLKKKWLERRNVYARIEETHISKFFEKKKKILENGDKQTIYKFANPILVKKRQKNAFLDIIFSEVSKRYGDNIGLERYVIKESVLYNDDLE